MTNQHTSAGLSNADGASTLPGTNPPASGETNASRSPGGLTQPGAHASLAMGRRKSDRIISASAPMQSVVDQASALARGSDTVLLVGPSGAGRKHVARSIHEWSSRAGSPLVEFQATGTSEAAQLRDLFGDGTAAHPGALRSAEAGTVLIDGADHLTASVLARLGDAATRGPARVLATATATAGTSAGPDLRSLAGPTHHIEITALADRVEDILPLAAHFLAEFAAEESLEVVGFSADARRWLIEEPWTGNVRELRERIRQAIRLAGQGAISAEALMLSTEGEEVPSFKDAKRAFETRYVEGLLRRCSGNISRAARMAKKDRKDFYDVIRRTGVNPAQFRG
jgi:two-component system response regulator GlrR